MQLLSRLPKLKRKYEVNESHWLVVRGRALLGWLSLHVRSFLRVARFQLSRARLALKWKRVPAVWEMAFIERMRFLGRKGVRFDDILKATLPQLMGIDTTHVLRSWVGKKARSDPERFAYEMTKLFGKSARRVVMTVNDLADEKLLPKETLSEEVPYLSVVNAIKKADEEADMLADLRERKLTAIVPFRGDERRPKGSGDS